MQINEKFTASDRLNICRVNYHSDESKKPQRGEI